MQPTDAELIAAVLKGDPASFEPLIAKYSPRLFATARRHARRESEVEDIVQEVWLKAFQKLGTFRGEAPFEHWLMRLAVRTCYDFLRGHQRNREMAFSELTEPEADWLERFVAQPDSASENAGAAGEGACLSGQSRNAEKSGENRQRKVFVTARFSGASKSLQTI